MMRKLYIDYKKDDVLEFLEVYDGDTVFCRANMEKSLLGTHSTKIYDSEKNKIGEIKEKKYRFGLYDLIQFILEIDGFEKITFSKEMEELKSFYKIEPESIELKGNWLNSNFNIEYNQQKIASVKKEEKRYTLEINDEDYKELAVSLLITILQVFHYERLL